MTSGAHPSRSRLAALSKALPEAGKQRQHAVEIAGEFGRLADALKQRGTWDQALFVFTADEGDHTWSVVRVTFGDADTYEALIDPSMGLLCCYRIIQKGV